ncbi:MAG: Hcp family type VI secretion system effector [Alphaproteobacteria bacterium]
MANQMVFVKPDGIDGESTDEKHNNWIEATSISFGAAASVTITSTAGARTGAERVNIQELQFTKPLDAASPKLFEHVCTGKHIPTVQIEFVNPVGAHEVFLKVKLTDAIVSGVSAAGGGDWPQESVSMAFSKIEFDYIQYGKDGSRKGSKTAGWDLAKNVKV